MSSDTPDAAQWLNDNNMGWNAAMGLRFVRASADEVVAELEVGERHLQPYGVIHGGVHAGVVETVCSTGAALWAMPQGLSVVGLENATSFLRAARGGRLTVTATPLARGRRTQVWRAAVRDDEDRLVAEGKVRLLCLEEGATLAGQGVSATPER